VFLHASPGHGLGFGAVTAFSALHFAQRGWDSGWMALTAFALCFIREHGRHRTEARELRQAHDLRRRQFDSTFSVLAQSGYARQPDALGGLMPVMCRLLALRHGGHKKSATKCLRARTLSSGVTHRDQGIRLLAVNGVPSLSTTARNVAPPSTSDRPRR
jgi:hypothetical protein